MKKAAILFVLGFGLSATALAESPSPVVTCFSSGERESGMYKICYYECLGDTVAITVKSYELCPLVIHR